ncbi:hypothetical protein PYCC9005_004771 [Savitreella phatthalungensis]
MRRALILVIVSATTILSTVSASCLPLNSSQLCKGFAGGGAVLTDVLYDWSVVPGEFNLSALPASTSAAVVHGVSQDNIDLLIGSWFNSTYLPFLSVNVMGCHDPEGTSLSSKHQQADDVQKRSVPPTPTSTSQASPPPPRNTSIYPRYALTNACSAIVRASAARGCGSGAASGLLCDRGCGMMEDAVRRVTGEWACGGTATVPASMQACASAATSSAACVAPETNEDQACGFANNIADLCVTCTLSRMQRRQGASNSTNDSLFECCKTADCPDLTLSEVSAALAQVSAAPVTTSTEATLAAPTRTASVDDNDEPQSGRTRATGILAAGNVSVDGSVDRHIATATGSSVPTTNPGKDKFASASDRSTSASHKVSFAIGIVCAILAVWLAMTGAIAWRKAQARKLEKAKVIEVDGVGEKGGPGDAGAGENSGICPPSSWSSMTSIADPEGRAGEEIGFLARGAGRHARRETGRAGNSIEMRFRSLVDALPRPRGVSPSPSAPGRLVGGGARTPTPQPTLDRGTLSVPPPLWDAPRSGGSSMPPPHMPPAPPLARRRQPREKDLPPVPPVPERYSHASNTLAVPLSTQPS